MIEKHSTHIGREVTLDQRIGMAQITVMNENMKRSKHQNTLNALYYQQKGIKEAIKRAEKRASNIDDMKHPLWTRVFALEEENDVVRKRIAELANEAYNAYNEKISEASVNLWDDILSEGKKVTDVSTCADLPTTIEQHETNSANDIVESSSSLTMETSLNTNKSTSIVSEENV